MGSEDILLPAALVLLVIAAGVIAARVWSRRAVVDRDADHDDAKARLAGILASLQELNAEAQYMEPSAYERERGTLERQAAEIQRQQELLTPKEPQPRTVSYLQRHPTFRGALYASVVFLVLSLIVYAMLGPSTSPRQAMTPRAPDETSMPPFIISKTSPQEEIPGVIATLTAEPNDLAALVRLGHLLIAARRLPEAEMVTARAIEIDPMHPEARAHQAALQSVRNRDAGLAAIDSLLKEQPKLAEAWLFRGMMGWHAGDMDILRQSFDEYLRLVPSGFEREHVRMVLERATLEHEKTR